MLHLNDKVAIVTGAAMGMGKSTAELFARVGAKVIVADYNVEEGQKTADEIKANGGEAMFIKVDVSNEEEVKKLVEKTVETYGRLDVAVNNAAITPDDKPIAEIDMAYYERLMAVDLKGVMLCMKNMKSNKCWHKEDRVPSLIRPPSVVCVRNPPIRLM